MEPNGTTYRGIPQQIAAVQGIVANTSTRSNRFQNPNWETPMVIADRLKALRKQKNMSQGDIEKRTGLLRCYISRVENGHTVPAIETLEKMAQALEVPMYALFYDGEKPPEPMIPTTGVPMGWGSSGRDAQTLHKFRRLMSGTNERDLKLLLYIAQKMSQKKRGRERRPGS
jgi:transcriptional regulator with XRE-family HTH domain